MRDVGAGDESLDGILRNGGVTISFCLDCGGDNCCFLKWGLSISLSWAFPLLPALDERPDSVRIPSDMRSNKDDALLRSAAIGDVGGEDSFGSSGEAEVWALLVPTLPLPLRLRTNDMIVSRLGDFLRSASVAFRSMGVGGFVGGFR